ncbi:hypothetical protein NDU88_000152 [Pleurodeles waltl]|uniref:Uncharacterized protein n=2 Tax=Pleurodeles waltl TaxID=8319 RepID=A0AAV7KMT6_PLEWA|nr:hypothetical protein NDU88_000152 [Pleurodeles waltl]
MIHGRSPHGQNSSRATASSRQSTKTQLSTSLGAQRVVAQISASSEPRPPGAIMGLTDWLTTLFSHKRVTDSQINILTESQPLTNLTPDGNVVLQSARPVVQGEPRSTRCVLEAEFSQLVDQVGGKEKFLFVGDAVISGKASGGGIFQELSNHLFGNTDGGFKGVTATEEMGKSNTVTGKTQSGLVELTHPAPAKSRVFKYPAILVVFKLTILQEKTNEVTIREILRDVRSRCKEAAPAIIGIVYCENGVSEDEERAAYHRLLRYLQDTFHPESSRGPRVSVCLYAKSRPKSILGVRSCVLETLRDSMAGPPSIPAESKYLRDQDTDLQKKFQDLVAQVGGKESFLLVGMLCPSSETADKVKLFQEVAQELFDEQRYPGEGSLCTPSSKGEAAPSLQPNAGNPGPALKPCTQLEKPQAFPFPVILVVFKLQFIKDRTSKVLIREILKDIRGRCKGVTPAIVGIVYSEEQTSEEQEQTSLCKLSRYLNETFHLEAGGVCSRLACVCFYVKSRPDSIMGVKKCICGVLRHQHREANH